MSGFSIHDLRFRRRGDDECDIVVYGQTVGAVMHRADIANPDGGWSYVIHLYNDRHGPKQIDDRNAIRSTIASMLIERDLVPWTPPPVHPDYAARRQHRPA
ncbi:MAG: hypothetical protein OXN81_16200 [Alphaproteobacteria bacterium]|nr:hypothetical protein [Alphaproteobacteria bacterium]